MRISIFGMGYVGAVSAACFAELGHDVIGVDVDAHKVAALDAGKSPIRERGVGARLRRAHRARRLRGTLDPADAVRASDVSLICVGTPSDGAGALDLDAVDAVVAQIGREIRRKSRHGVVVRSTVPPGATDGRLAPMLAEHAGRRIGRGLELAINPEFLREGSGVRDFLAPAFTLSGSVGEDGHRYAEALYRGIASPLVKVDCRTAESIKVVSNAFHALKVVFANEVGTVLKHLGADVDAAMRVFCADRRLNISAAYLRPGFAFGGSCLPKEVRALESLAEAARLDMPTLRSILPSNRQHAERAFDLIQRHAPRRIALFGLSFKPGTGDVRESPYVALALRLLRHGSELAVFDQSLASVHDRELDGAGMRTLARRRVDDPAACLDGADTIVIGHACPPAVDVIAARHAGRPIVDLQGVPALRTIPGVRYEGLCW